MSRIKNVSFLAAVILAAAVFLSASPAFVYAQSQELQQIRQAIKAKNARWHADETSVSKLTLKEKKLRLGASEEEEFAAELLLSRETAPIPLVTAAPPTLDWRGLEGISYVTPVKNQGNCGSCWAFATTAGLESQVMIAAGGMPIDLSEQILVSCSGCGSCSGGSSAAASSYIRDVGLPLESCFKYTATNDTCSNACADWQYDAYNITAWHSAYTKTVSVDAIKNALYAYGPVVATMYVYNDFYSYRSGVYSYTTGSYLGAHAVLAVGYDDAQQAFIVKNSWGTGWGEAGYFMIAYSEVTGKSKFGYATMVYDGYDAPMDPVDPVPEPDPVDPIPDPIDPTPDPVDPDPEPEPCTYSLSGRSASFDAEGGSGSFMVYVNGTCSLTSLSAVSGASWVTISSTSEGTGGLTIYYTVDVNTTGASRSTAINVAGLSYGIRQKNK